mmetsp:Transcript_23364/g.59908  ORF Transcript_23364/g.59908 Transcript_23364/m.59908 type:complete len:251 (-) Transcript_23364:220-972(-)
MASYHTPVSGTWADRSTSSPSAVQDFGQRRGGSLQPVPGPTDACTLSPLSPLTCASPTELPGGRPKDLWRGRPNPPLPSLVQDQTSPLTSWAPSPLGPPSSSRQRKSVEYMGPAGEEQLRRSSESYAVQQAVPGSMGPHESYSTRMKRTGGVINSQTSVHRPPQHGGTRGSPSGSGQQAGGASRPAPSSSELELMGAFRQAQRGEQQHEAPLVVSQVECRPTSLRAMLDGFEEWAAAMETGTAARNLPKP